MLPMKLTLLETMGVLNEKALMLAHRMLSDHQPANQVTAEVRKALVMPAFHGNLLAVRLTDRDKVKGAEVPAELEPAREVVLQALAEEIRALEPMYRERLAGSHK